MKILIHESDNDIRQLYRVIFSPLNVELTFSENAVETRAKADRSQYDLVMMDVEFPTMEGLSVARSMVEERPDRPLLLVSSVPLEQNELAAPAKRSRSAIMMKPFNIAELRSLIRNLTGIQSSTDSKPLHYLQPASVN